jgi:DNA-binding Xre family transcriptional regulator
MGNVRFTIEAAARRKGVENPFALSRATGLGYAICHRLWNDEQRRVDLGTLASICDALECQPGDLLIYVPGKKKGAK